jgi:hypothetical protein
LGEPAALEERPLGWENLGVSHDLFWFQRAAEGAAAEGIDELRPAGGVIVGGRFARNQTMEIVAEKRIRGQLFGLTLETIDEILGREIADGIAGVLKQVAVRIVGLAVSPTP